MITIVTDTKEQKPLTFPKMEGVSVVREHLDVGDYACRYGNGEWDETIFERKAMGDLFTSFSSGYNKEKSKIERAKVAGKRYVIAVEASTSKVLKGHKYRKGGKWIESKKSGLSMCRQLMTLEFRYGLITRYFSDRGEMAFFIMEWFLTAEKERNRAGLMRVA